METFKNFLAVLITLLVFALWILPAFMMYHGLSNSWGTLYLPICILTGLWGGVLWNKYY